MLENTFIHIKGIGQKTEQKMWKKGIQTWQHFLNHVEPIFSSARDQLVKEELMLSTKHISDIRFFLDRLSSGDTWRVFDAFKQKAAYLDIETSGGYQWKDEITVIGLFDGSTVHTFVNGISLNEFEIAITQYDLIITFNGTTFDLPVIRRWFPNISLPPAHIDLRFLLKKLGYIGGLKKIEKAFGLIRDPEIAGMEGYDAVLLWKAYLWGDRDALRRLIKYNTADIVNLKPLMEMGYGEMKSRLLPFGRD